MKTTTGIEISSGLEMQMIDFATRTGEGNCKLLFKIDRNYFMGEDHVVIECGYNPNFNSNVLYPDVMYLGSIFNINEENEEFEIFGYVKSFIGEMSCSDEDLELIKKTLLLSTCDIATI